MDDKLFKEVCDILLALETAAIDYAVCKDSEERHYNHIIEQKEDALIALINRLVDNRDDA